MTLTLTEALKILRDNNYIIRVSDTRKNPDMSWEGVDFYGEYFETKEERYHSMFGTPEQKEAYSNEPPEIYIIKNEAYTKGGKLKRRRLNTQQIYEYFRYSFKYGENIVTEEELIFLAKKL